MAATQRLAPLDFDFAPTALINRISRRLRYRLDVRLEPYGVTGVQYGVLARLAASDGRSQGELQQSMSIEGATMTNIVQRLERESWISRTSDPEDRRRQRVWLTDKARGLLPSLEGEVERFREDVMHVLSSTETDELARLLRRIEENLA